jgi:hypothetical protein
MWKGFTKRQNYGQSNEEDTGSESEYKGAWGAEYTGAYQGDEGHPIPVGTVATPFYQVNPARWNGADREPIPITPVRGQNWPEMQIQLRNGWGTTSFGKKLSYDSYLRMLTDSATKNRKYLIPNPSGLGPHAQRPGPAPANVQSLINNSSGAQPDAPGGPGFLAGNVNLTGRTYYG